MFNEKNKNEKNIFLELLETKKILERYDVSSDKHNEIINEEMKNIILEKKVFLEKEEKRINNFNKFLNLIENKKKYLIEKQKKEEEELKKKKLQEKFNFSNFIKSGINFSNFSKSYDYNDDEEEKYVKVETKEDIVKVFNNTLLNDLIKDNRIIGYVLNLIKIKEGEIINYSNTKNLEDWDLGNEANCIKFFNRVCKVKYEEIKNVIEKEKAELKEFNEQWGDELDDLLVSYFNNRNKNFLTFYINKIKNVNNSLMIQQKNIIDLLIFNLQRYKNNTIINSIVENYLNNKLNKLNYYLYKNKLTEYKLLFEKEYKVFLEKNGIKIKKISKKINKILENNKKILNFLFEDIDNVDLNFNNYNDINFIQQIEKINNTTNELKYLYKKIEEIKVENSFTKMKLAKNLFTDYYNYKINSIINEFLQDYKESEKNINTDQQNNDNVQTQQNLNQQQPSEQNNFNESIDINNILNKFYLKENIDMKKINNIINNVKIQLYNIIKVCLINIFMLNNFNFLYEFIKLNYGYQSQILVFVINAVTVMGAILNSKNIKFAGKNINYAETFINNFNIKTNYYENEFDNILKLYKKYKIKKNLKKKK